MKITKEQKDRIVELYNQGIGATTVARQVGVSETGVKYTLKQRGYTIRPMKEYRKYTLNENYFEIIDTAEKAYWLGFLYADGYNHEGRGETKLCLNKDDAHHIEAFKLAIGSNQPLKENACNLRDNTIQIVVNNKKFSADLAVHGCVQNKSLVLRFPTTVEDKWFPSFMRGYFDGDGTVYGDIKRGAFSITSSYDFCVAYADVLTKNCGLNPAKLKTKANTAHKPMRSKAWHISYGGRNVLTAIYSFLYSIPEQICLLRKKDKFEVCIFKADEASSTQADEESNNQIEETAIEDVEVVAAVA